MKIFLAGATGAVGKSLVPLLVSRGHRVFATTRTPEKAATLRAAGAEPIVVDGLDRKGLLEGVCSARPDVVVHEMTGLAGMKSLRNIDETLALTNRLRTEGTEYLLAAAGAARARRFVAQSFTGWPNAREGGRLRTEGDALDAHPARRTERTLEAIRRLEALVLGATDLDSVVLRYGAFYGPGTALEPGGEFVEAVRKRRFPIVGNGGGITSHIHVDDAAAATVAAIERGEPGIYNVVDDEPAPMREWLPVLASVLGAKPPRRIPRWLGRLAAGEAATLMMTEVRGASNAKAKRELGWRLRYPSWRQGFAQGLQ
jgi:nucleoside-diphosphate-sugar epimerase